MQERQKRLEMELEYVRSQHKSNEVGVIMSNHEREVADLHEQLSSHQAQQQALATSLESLTATRDDLFTRLSMAQQSLMEEHRRMEGLEEQNAALQKGIVRIVQDKHLIWSQASDLLEAAKIGVAQVNGQWQADRDAPECSACHAHFGVMLRRHHCRVCGQVFCARCSSHKVQVCHQQQRACLACVDRTQMVQAQGPLPTNGISTAAMVDDTPRAS